MYRSCSLPITSFGIVCFRWTVNTSGQRAPQFLMVQRKDSLCFVEFVRGRYDLNDTRYVRHLLRKMTAEERGHLTALSFTQLWFGFWQTDQNRSYMREFQQAQHKHACLVRGVPDTETVETVAEGDGTNCAAAVDPRAGPAADAKRAPKTVDLASLLASTESQHGECEWGFPKGRRNINEKDSKCAMREFREETGLGVEDVHVHTYVKPFEEVFVACNGVRYRHVYYLAQLKQEADAISDGPTADVALQKDNKSQQREISRVCWFDAATVFSKINPDNPERRRMFDDVLSMVTGSQFLAAVRADWSDCGGGGLASASSGIDNRSGGGSGSGSGSAKDEEDGSAQQQARH